MNPLDDWDAWFTELCFDRAVTWFGRWVEAKLHEYDDKFKPKYTLAGLLGDGAPQGRDVPGGAAFRLQDIEIVEVS